MGITYWHMQMYKKADKGREKELFENNQVILFCDEGTNKKQEDKFKNEIKIEDIILIKRGAKSIALVQVKGNCQKVKEGETYNQTLINGENHSYGYERKIELLAYAPDNIEKFPQPQRRLQNLNNTNTKTYKYIDKWYNEILENEKNNKIINIEDYQKNFTISTEELKIKLNKTNDIKHIDILNFYKESIKDIETIDIEIENVKSVRKFTEKFRIKLDNGLYTIVGNNGIGKSALLISLGHLIKHTFLQTEFKGDAFDDSKITYVFNNLIKFEWKKYNQKDKTKTWTIQNKKFYMPKIDGFFESGIISGSRFEHLEFKKETLNLINKNYIKNDIEQDKRSLKFIRKNLTYIINGKNTYKYSSLFSQKITDKKEEKNIYFYENENKKIISEYSFSTGEYFVLALLKFIATKIDKNIKSLIIIDEIDISLHPLAQKRLIETIKCFKDRYNITFILATHSLQIIENLDAENIYYFENDNGNITISNPIYPAYVTKDIYEHQYYDKVLLVEDNLAKSFLEKVIKRIDRNNELKNKVHYKIFAIGDWRKVLEVARDNQKYKYYPKASVLPILDDDVSKNDKDNNKQANALKWKKNEKTFIPIEDNIEKYTVKTLLKDTEFIKMIELDLISPNKFNDLDIQGQEKNTDQIKNKFSKGKHSIVRQVCDYSEKNEKEIIEKIIEFIFQSKVKSNSEKYSNFEKTLKTFFEINNE